MIMNILKKVWLFIQLFVVAIIILGVIFIIDVIGVWFRV